MTPDQALLLLDQAASRAPLTREEHVAVMTAITTLRNAISEPKPHKLPPEDSGHG